MQLINLEEIDSLKSRNDTGHAWKRWEEIGKDYKNGRNILQLSKKYDVDRNVIKNILHKQKIKRRSPAEEKRLTTVTKKVDFTKREDLFYILGVMYGDGSKYIRKDKNNGHIIQLEVKSKEFASSFKRSLENIGLNVIFGNHKPNLYRALTCSVFLYGWIDEYDINNIVHEPKKLKSCFLRGIYESEGTLRGKNYLTAFCGNNIELKEIVKSVLTEFNFSLSEFKSDCHYEGCYKPSGDVHYIRIKGGKGRKEWKRFLNLTNPCIKNEMGD